MSWVRVDDRAWSHPKLTKVGGNSVKLWLFGLCWCNQHQTDGVIPKHALTLLGGTKKSVTELVSAGLWETTGDGWNVRNYLEFQPSRAQLEEQKARTLERVKRHRNAVTPTKCNGDVTRSVTGGVTGAPTQPNPTQPNPTHRDPPLPPGGGVGPQPTEVGAPKPTTRKTKRPKSETTDQRIKPVADHYANTFREVCHTEPDGKGYGLAGKRIKDLPASVTADALIRAIDVQLRKRYRVQYAPHANRCDLPWIVANVQEITAWANVPERTPARSLATSTADARDPEFEQALNDMWGGAPPE